MNRNSLEAPVRGDGLSSAWSCCMARERPASTMAISAPLPDFAAIEYEQPLAARSFMEFEPPQRPVTAISLASISSLRRRVHSDMIRAKTASFSGLGRPLTSHSMANTSRPSISGPSDFRRLSGNFQSDTKLLWRPLTVSISEEEGRLMPLPDFSGDDWIGATTELQPPQPAVLRDYDFLHEDPEETTYPLNSNPVSRSMRDLAQRYSRESTILSPHQVESLATRRSTLSQTISADGYNGDLDAVDEPFPAFTGLPQSRPRTSSNPRRSKSPENAGHTRSLSDIVVWPLRSSSSMRRRQLSGNVEDEIRELNTIVEERRVSALRNQADDTVPLSPTAHKHHIPAIAPAMKVRARSETLDAIGSAFSMPLSNNANAQLDEDDMPTPTATTHSITPPPANKESKPVKNSFLRSWLTRSKSPNELVDFPPAPPATPPHFYNCDPATSQAESSVSTRSDSSLSSYTSTTFEDDRSPSFSYAPTTATTITPQSFSPTRELAMDLRTPTFGEHQQPPGKQTLRRMPALPKRGLSIDTTMTSSSVSTSILSGPSSHKHSDSFGRMSELPEQQQYLPSVGMAI